MMSVGQRESDIGPVFRPTLSWLYVRLVVLALLSAAAVARLLTSLDGPEHFAIPIVLCGLLTFGWRSALKMPYEVRFTLDGVAFKSMIREAYVPLSEIEGIEFGAAGGCVIRHTGGTIALSRIFDPQLPDIVSRLKPATAEV